MGQSFQIMGILNVTPDSFSDGGRYFHEGRGGVGSDEVRDENVRGGVVGSDEAGRGGVEACGSPKEDDVMTRRGVDVERAVQRAFEMAQEGADIIDVGGESTGPGSLDVSLEEELARVIPVIRGIRKMEESRGMARQTVQGVGHAQGVVQGMVHEVAHAVDPSPVKISIDTWKAEVARQAILAGADMVNDVTALRGDPEMVRVVAEAGVPVVLMYSKDPSARTTGGTEGAMEYEDVIETVRVFLEERIAFAERAGIAREQIIVDPGMGAFVSSIGRYSLEILERLVELKALGCAILVGASRKSFIREIWGGERPENRLEGSLKAAKLAAFHGATILRVHDVKETVAAVGRGGAR